MTAGTLITTVLADLEARKLNRIRHCCPSSLILASTGGSVSNGCFRRRINLENIPAHAFLGLSIADATKNF